MKTHRYFLLSIALLFFSFCLPLSLVKATVFCPVTQSGDVTLTESCVFTGSVDGAANGNVNVNAGVTLTVQASQTIVVSNGKKFDVTASGAKIVIIDSGNMKTDAVICLTDADSDTYPESLDPSAQTLAVSTCPAGKIKRDDPSIHWLADCNDDPNNGGASQFANLTCYPNADGDAYYSTTSHSVCGSGATCAAIGESATVGTDCDDSNNAKYAMIQCYADADGDTAVSANSYAKTLGTAFCGSTCAAAGQSATIGTDCCDTDANAYVGQASYFTTATACGGFDYNCVNGEEHYYTGSGAYMSCSANSSTQSCDSVGGSTGWSSSDPGCGNSANWKIAGCCRTASNGGDCSGTVYSACGAGNLANYTYTQQCR